MLDLIIFLIIFLSIIIIPLALLFYIGGRYYNVRRSQLLIVYRTENDGNLRITRIRNENTFVMPYIESHTFLQSDIETHELYVEDLKCKYGISINLEMVLQLRIIPGPELIALLESDLRFRTTGELRDLAIDTVKGAVRRIVKKYSLETLKIGTTGIAKNIHSEATPGLNEMGFELFSIRTRVVSDDIGYLSLLEQMKILDEQKHAILGVTPEEKKEYLREIEKKEKETEQMLDNLRQEYGVDMEEVEKELRSIMHDQRRGG